MNTSVKQKVNSWAIVLVILSALFYCYEYILRISPNVMMPSIMHHYALTAGGAGLLVSLYYFIYTPLQIVVGVITDRYGPKRIISWAIAFCVLGAFLFPATHHVSVAGLGRLMIGTGSAFAYVGALAIANKNLNKEWFTFFAGAVTTLGMVGAIVGDIGMGGLMAYYGFKGIFALLVVIGLALLLAFMVAVYFRKKTIGEKKEPVEPSVSFRELKNIILSRRFVLLGTIGALLFMSLDIFAELWGIQFLQAARHINVTEAATINSFIFWGWAVGSPSQAVFYKLLKTTRRCFIVETLLAAVFIILALTFSTSSTLTLKTLLFFFGFFCSVEILCFSAAVQWVRHKSAATAVAVINFFVMMSGMLFQPLSSALINWSAHHASGNIHVYTANDYFTTLMILPIAALVAFGLSFALPKVEHKIQK